MWTNQNRAELVELVILASFAFVLFVPWGIVAALVVFMLAVILMRRRLFKLFDQLISAAASAIRSVGSWFDHDYDALRNTAFVRYRDDKLAELVTEEAAFGGFLRDKQAKRDADEFAEFKNKEKV